MASKSRKDAQQTNPKTAPAGREPVTLSKGNHHWTFTCDAGCETGLLERLAELASDPEAPFDWFDLALVSHQVRDRLRADLSRQSAGGSVKKAGCATRPAGSPPASIPIAPPMTGGVAS